MTLKKTTNIFALFFAYLILLSGCIHQDHTTKEDILSIDMEEYESVNFNSLVENISCIKLISEPKQKLDNCKRMIRYKNNIYLLAGNGVYIYKESGDFIKKITFRDRETLFLSTLFIEPYLDEVWIISNHNIVNKYNLDGIFISKLTLPFSCTDIISCSEGRYLVYDGYFNREWNHLIALTDLSSPQKHFISKENKIKTQYLPQSLYSVDINSNNIFIFPTKKDTIYYYNPATEHISPYYSLDFHGDLLIEKIYPEKGFSDEEMADIIEQKRYINSIYSFYCASHKLFFKLSGKRDDFCIINLENHHLQSFQYLFDNYKPTTHNPFIGSDGKSLYCIIKESALVQHYANHTCTFSGIQQLLPSLQADGEHYIILNIEIKES